MKSDWWNATTATESFQSMIGEYNTMACYLIHFNANKIILTKFWLLWLKGRDIQSYERKFKSAFDGIVCHWAKEKNDQFSEKYAFTWKKTSQQQQQQLSIISYEEASFMEMWTSYRDWEGNVEQFNFEMHLLILLVKKILPYFWFRHYLSRMQQSNWF